MPNIELKNLSFSNMFSYGTNNKMELHKNRITQLTAPNGSGKSSIAFETIYKEGQRRYMDTFSAYARQFIDNFERWVYVFI